MDAYLEKYGPVAIVAGASVGIGAEIADQLAARGFDLVLIARGADALEARAAALRAAHRVEVITVPLDLSTPEATQRIADETAHLDVGLLVYNAATGYSGPFWGKDLDGYHAMLGVNIMTPFDLVHTIAPRLMRRRRGGIIMVSSGAGQTAQPYMTAYSSAKAWNTNFSLGLWEELRPYGVDVLNAIVGSTDTPGLREVMQEAFLSRTRMASARDVAAETLAWLGRGPVRIVGGFQNRAVLGAFRLIGLTAALRLMSTFMARRVYGGTPPRQPEHVIDPGGDAAPRA